jgi:hypothetical protein
MYPTTLPASRTLLVAFDQYSCYRLTVRGVGLGSDDTFVDKVNIAPVLTLGTLTIYKSGSLGDCSPKGTAS